MPPHIGSVIAPILGSNQLAAGPNVAAFEELLRQYIGNPLLTTTGDASTSIAICLYLAGVRPGDEVIASPLACLATNQPILNLFARVRWCDIDPLTGNVDPADVARKITQHTKAVLLFHWAGNPADLAPIYELSRRAGLPVVEDASEALGAEYARQKLGNTGGDYVIFSFYPNRHLTTIEGAAIAFGDKAQYERGRCLKRYGIHAATFRTADGEINPHSDITEPGWNSYLNHVAATMGIAQLQDLHHRLAVHQENGLFYDAQLPDIRGLTVLRRPDTARSAFWVYTFLAERRDELLKHLWAHGIHASKVHLRNDVYSCFGPHADRLPGVDYFAEHTISIPCGWWVTDESRSAIVQVIREGW